MRAHLCTHVRAHHRHAQCSLINMQIAFRHFMHTHASVGVCFVLVHRIAVSVAERLQCIRKWFGVIENATHVCVHATHTHARTHASLRHVPLSFRCTEDAKICAHICRRRHRRHLTLNASRSQSRYGVCVRSFSAELQHQQSRTCNVNTLLSGLSTTYARVHCAKCNFHHLMMCVVSGNHIMRVCFIINAIMTRIHI